MAAAADDAPPEAVLETLSLEELWRLNAESRLPEMSPESVTLLRELWFSGAYAGLLLAQQCCRAAPVVRDEQVARLVGECWTVARAALGADGTN